MAADYPVTIVCETLGVARSSYYHEAAGRDDEELRQALQELAGRWPTYGYRRMTAELQRAGWTVNRKRVAQTMAELGLQAKVDRKRMQTTNSRHGGLRFPNLVLGRQVQRPDEVWVADITYVVLGRGFVYLAVVMDVFTRAVRGWQLSRNLGQGLALTALQRALQLGQPEIHHSDQGVQYAAQDYVRRLQEQGVQVSMSRRGAAWQNGYAERLMRTIKEEEVYLSEYRDYADAQRQIGQFLDDVYMHKRIHSALGYLTPVEFALQWEETEMAAEVIP
jgi:transposase InsO family protein